VPNERKPPLLVIVCGLSFAGKTTLGNAIARHFGYVEVDVDDVKVRLYGVDYGENNLDQNVLTLLGPEFTDERAPRLG
jgi:predicted kinase